MFFLVFFHVLHNLPFYRGITCISLEYAECPGMFHFFLVFVSHVLQCFT